MTNPLGGNNNKNVNHTNSLESVRSGRKYSKAGSDSKYDRPENLHEWVKSGTIHRKTPLLNRSDIPQWLLEIVYDVVCDIRDIPSKDAYGYVSKHLHDAAVQHGVTGQDLQEYNFLASLISRYGKRRILKYSGDSDQVEKESVDAVKSTFNKVMSAAQRGVRIFVFLALVALAIFGTIQFPFLPIILAAAFLTMFIMTMMFRAAKNKHSVLDQEAIVAIKMSSLNIEVDLSDPEVFSERLGEDVKISLKCIWNSLVRCLSRNGDEALGDIKLEIPNDDRETYIYLYGEKCTAKRFGDCFSRLFGFKG